MIVTVTLNAALDTSYAVPRVLPGTSHRVRTVERRAGGKGINVARVLHAMGHPVRVTGFAGGATGAAIRADLAVAGMADALVPIAAESRRTVSAVSDATGEATLFNEPGPPVSELEWQRLVGSVRDLALDASVVVMSGSLPAGVPPDAYASLVAVAQTAGAAAIVDADGAMLRDALPARPDVVKPNALESAAATGLDDPVAGAAWLRRHGAGAVVTTLGPDGLLADTPEGAWRAWLPDGLLRPVNPTGAGDACVAAIAAGLEAGWSWPVRLTTAVAWSAAAVVAPLAGDLEMGTLEGIAGRVRLEEQALDRPDR